MTIPCNFSYNQEETSLKTLLRKCSDNPNSFNFFQNHILPCYENKSIFFERGAVMPDRDMVSVVLIIQYI